LSENDGTVSLTGDGSEDIRDEDFHQTLVQAVVTVPAPAQHWFILAQQHQAGLWETFLGLIMTVKTPTVCLKTAPLQQR